MTIQSATALCGDQLARGRGVAGVVPPTDDQAIPLKATWLINDASIIGPILSARPSLTMFAGHDSPAG